MYRTLALCLAAALAAGCGDDPKPTPAAPQQPPVPQQKPDAGKKTGPGYGQLSAPDTRATS